MSLDTAIDRPNVALITADKVKGTEVYNAGDEKLGSIDSILIDKVSGEVAYVVMSFGGFLGIGERYHPLPWHVLDYDTMIGGYRVDLDRATLDAAPDFSRDEVDSFDYDRDAQGIDSYYSPEGRGVDSDRPVSTMVDRQPLNADQNSQGNPNDGRDGRPLGYFSEQAQADRSMAKDAVPGETNDAAERPGFYSPEQQATRSVNAENANAHLRDNSDIDRLPDGSPRPTTTQD